MLNCGLINKLRKNIFFRLLTGGTPGKYLVVGWLEFQSFRYRIDNTIIECR